LLVLERVIKNATCTLRVQTHTLTGIISAWSRNTCHYRSDKEFPRTHSRLLVQPVQKSYPSTHLSYYVHSRVYNLNDNAH
jgi:hypothetical protein